ncbi:mitochondrial import inner membrane translocase subunit Tim54 [Lophiotrema nucula]|uniref:Mitochondrial import inner membrane translocase subunit TIM54 n=1 Tax=Lophiotrema nucula TaxID=690887 RepID=A0A6A5YN18_9PLEO|nr:mitochondrial import inner membrane translocase subunit Tim54 [Lophiotrema nucula]
MADKDARASAASSGSAGPAKPAKPPNPVWRMMGLPNFRLKLPSRNWLIFLGVTGTWTAAVLYDRREKKRIQRKWSRLVEHIALEPLYEHQMPRKLTVYLSAPPADGLVPARDHFHEYVKPILVAAALDWDAVEGRREGDVRAGLAERIRRTRKRREESTVEPLEADAQEILDGTRERAGIKEWDGTAGDIVIGRHAWKEYVRGLHEGWLGPLDTPVAAEETIEVPAVVEAPTLDANAPSTPPSDDASPTAVPDAPPPESEKPKEEENKPKKKKQPPPFNTPADYNNSVLSPSCPPELPPSTVVPLPHILGFLNFPIRMYRFLNRRQVADEVGRHTAAAVLGVYRPYDSAGGANFESSMTNDNDEGSPLQWEQQRLLVNEEAEWHKSARERKDDDDKERVWLDDMVLDPRIAERMRKFELDTEAEERAKTIPTQKDVEPWWKSVWPKTETKKGAWEDLD